MEYQIRQLSDHAANILEHLTVGTIHSVYRRTMNLTDGRQILSLQTEQSPLSPISLICGLTADDFGRLSVSPGDTVRFHNDGILIACDRKAPRTSYRFTFSSPQYYDLKLSKTMDARSRLALTASIREAVSRARTGGFSLLFHDFPCCLLAPDAAASAETNTEGSLSLVLLAAKNAILRSNKLLLERKYQEAALELLRLLGLGYGLTPSGDDFLCGVLAGMLLFGITDHPFAKEIKEGIQARLADTIDISAAFLSCALKAQFSLPVVSLYGLPCPDEILTSFSAVGHSSGIDTLCGILWSLEHIVRNTLPLM